MDTNTTIIIIIVFVIIVFVIVAIVALVQFRTLGMLKPTTHIEPLDEIKSILQSMNLTTEDARAILKNLTTEDARALLQQLIYLPLEERGSVIREFTRKTPDYVKLSITYPPKCAKGFSSQFMVNLYISGAQDVVEKIVATSFLAQEHQEEKFDVKVPPQVRLTIKLFCPVIEFSEPVTKIFTKEAETVVYTGKPLETCPPGKNAVLISIRNAENSAFL